MFTPFKDKQGFGVLSSLFAILVLTIVSLAAYRGISKTLQVRRSIASDTSYQDIEQSIISDIGLNLGDFLTTPDNCSCAQGFKDQWSKHPIGALKASWLDPTTISAYLTDPTLSPEQRGALNRCLNQSTSLNGFLADPALLSDASTCAMASIAPNSFVPTTGYSAPSGIYFCLNLAADTSVSLPISGSVSGSKKLFLEARFEMMNTFHHLSTASCRDFATQTVVPRLGGTTGVLYTTLYWQWDQAHSGSHSTVFSVPIEEDPPWRFIGRFYRDGFGREGTFEEIYLAWRQYRDLVAKISNPTASDLISVRSKIIQSLITVIPSPLWPSNDSVIEFGVRLVNNWLYLKWNISPPASDVGGAIGCNDVMANPSLGSSPRQNILHVASTADNNPPFFCQDQFLSRANDNYQQWDYAKVFGQNVFGKDSVWLREGGGACIQNADGTYPPPCAVTCEKTVTLMYRNLLGRDPNVPPSQALSEGHQAYLNCSSNPPFSYDNTGVLRHVGYFQGADALAIAQGKNGSEFVVQQLYNQYLHRDPVATEYSTFGDTKLSANGERMIDVILEIVSGDEYFNIRP